MLNRYTVTYIAYFFKDSDLHFGGQVLVTHNIIKDNLTLSSFVH